VSFILHTFLTLSASLIVAILGWGFLSRSDSPFTPDVDMRKKTYLATLVLGILPVFMPVHIFFLISVALFVLLALSGDLLSKAWNFSLSELEFFGAQASLCSRIPVYGLSGLLIPVYVLSGLLIPSVFLATSLSFWGAIVGLFLTFATIYGFGIAVFSGSVKYSNDFNVIGQDGKAMSRMDSFFYIALRVLSSFHVNERWYR